ncbi:hypothetical protein SDJN03_18616, partial [Cucurbita argyrosperma subsp. sororia]
MRDRVQVLFYLPGVGPFKLPHQHKSITSISFPLKPSLRGSGAKKDTLPSCRGSGVLRGVPSGSGEGAQPLNRQVPKKEEDDENRGLSSGSRAVQESIGSGGVQVVDLPDSAILGGGGGGWAKPNDPNPFLWNLEKKLSWNITNS